MIFRNDKVTLGMVLHKIQEDMDFQRDLERQKEMQTCIKESSISRGEVGWSMVICILKKKIKVHSTYGLNLKESNEVVVDEAVQ